MRFVFLVLGLTGLFWVIMVTDWSSEYEAKVVTDWALACDDSQTVEQFWAMYDSEDVAAAESLLKEQVGKKCVILQKGSSVFVNRQSDIPTLDRVTHAQLAQIRLNGSSKFIFASLRQIKRIGKYTN